MNEDYTLNRGGDLHSEAGKQLAESFANQGSEQMLKENFGIDFKETGQTTSNNTGSYVDLLSSTLHTAALDRIEPILDLVEQNEDMMNSQGHGAYKIPRLTPTIAYEVAEGEVVNYFDEGIDSIVVTPKKVVVGTSLTWEIMERGMSGFARYVMQNAAEAIERKLASDIVNGLAAGAAASNNESGGITMDKVRTVETNIKEATYGNGVKYGFIPDALVLTPTAHSKLQDSDEYQNAVHPASGRPGEDTNLQHVPLMFGNLEIVETPFLTDAEAIVLQKGKNLLVKEAELETYEGQIRGRPYDTEVVALMSYVVAIIYPDSMGTITS